jgi:tetratricopeptide (TPR) repeat protein
VSFDWSDRYEPVDRIGWSIHVFRISTEPGDAHREDIVYVPRDRWYEDAIERLEKILLHSPDFSDAEQLLGDVLGLQAHHLAFLERREEALDSAFRSLQIEPRQPTLRRFVVDLLDKLRNGARKVTIHSPAELLDQADEFRSRGKNAAAVIALLQIVATDRDSLDAHERLAAIYQELGFPRLAERHWRTCLLIDPGFGPAREALRGPWGAGMPQD